MRTAFIVALLAMATLSTAEAQTRKQHCAMWHNRCLSTCPPNVSKAACRNTCRQRLSDCRASGCYFFNIPGPRCMR